MPDKNQISVVKIYPYDIEAPKKFKSIKQFLMLSLIKI